MSGETFHIRPAWPDTMVYDEGEGREIRFQCRSFEEPPQVVVPTAQQWCEAMPAWAHELRDRIRTRLRSAGCVLVEVEGNMVRIVAPDDSYFLEEERFPPDRAGGWEVLRVWSLPARERLLQLSGYSLYRTLRFPRPGQLVLGIQSYGGRQYWEAHIDLEGRTYRLQGGERPLALLESELGATATPPAPAAPPPAPSLRARVGNALLVSGSLLFVAGGVWVACSANNTKDFWTGVLGIVFFGACAASPLLDRRPSGRRRNP